MDIFPTAYFGNIRYFNELIASSNPFIETAEHFVKQTVRSRCAINSANGIQHLSIPVVRPSGSKTATTAVGISYDTYWEKDHWKAIESAYAAAPYFEFYDKEVKELIFSKPTSLIEFNTLITKQILTWLDIPLELKFTNEFIGLPDGRDYRSFPFDSRISHSPYIQVFSDSNSFTPNLSIRPFRFLFQKTMLH